MSFASEIKEIICESTDEKWCCRRSELIAMLSFGATVKNNILKIKSESNVVFERLVSLLDEVCNVGRQKITIPAKDGGRCVLAIESEKEIERLGEDLGFEVTCEKLNFLDEEYDFSNACCVRSFIKGAYLIGGSISDPNKNYHLEFVCKQPQAADALFSILAKNKNNESRTIISIRFNN